MHHLHSLPMVEQTAVITRGTAAPSAEEAQQSLPGEASNAKSEQTVQLQRVLHVMHCCIGKQRWPMWGHAIDCVDASHCCAVDRG